jgi:hypothetical protein
MNHNSPYRYGPIPHGTVFILFFIEKYLKKYFVLPKLPLNEINYFVHHNSYNNVQILHPIASRKALLNYNSLLTIRVPEMHITSASHSNMPRTPMIKTWSLLSFWG